MDIFFYLLKQKVVLLRARVLKKKGVYFMKTIFLFLVAFSFVAFAANADNTISEDQQALLQDTLAEVYGQEAVDAVKMQEKAKSQVLAELPEALLNCAFGESDAAQADLPPSFQTASCDSVVSAAKDMGITQAQVESAIGQLDSEEDRIETLEAYLAEARFYWEAEVNQELQVQGDLAEIVAQLPEKFSDCRGEETGTVESLIPDIFQSSYCDAVATDAKEAGVSYVMAKGILDNLKVDDEAVAQAEAKPRTVSKP